MLKYKILICFVLLFLESTMSSAQDGLFSPTDMREDFQFIRHQLFHAHANPFSKFKMERYQIYLDSLEAGLTTPLSAAAFQQKAALALLPLDDEHAALSLRRTAPDQKAPSWADSIATNMSYRRIGNRGYILARSFATRGNRDLAVYQHCIDSIFTLIQRDGITHLAIDVSRNDGGASAIGNMLISYIYRKPYQTYSMNWKRSEEYLVKLTSWGFSDEAYQKALPGEIIHFPSRTVKPANVSNPFTGKVVVIIGPETFSSAIMFATLVQDNRMAPLVGESPALGHPTHFGEMYSVVLPRTQLELRFGVKEWVRPAGRSIVNKLVPDIPNKLPAHGDFTTLLKNLPW